MLTFLLNMKSSFEHSLTIYFLINHLTTLDLSFLIYTPKELEWVIS